MRSRIFRILIFLVAALVISEIFLLDSTPEQNDSTPNSGASEFAKAYAQTAALAGTRLQQGQTVVDYVHRRSPPQVSIDELSRLKQEATAGDAKAASKLASYSNHCAAIQSTTRLMDAFLGQDVGAMSGDQRVKYEHDLQRVNDLFEQYSEICDQGGHQLVDQRREILLTASKLGDRDAGDCFASLAIDMTGLGLDADTIGQYREYATRFLDKGVVQGDWTAVRLLLSAYHPAEYFRKDSTAALVKADSHKAYAYAKLLQLGQALDVESPPISEDYLAELSRGMSAAEVASADDWANQVFAKSFSAQPKYEGTPECK